MESSSGDTAEKTKPMTPRAANNPRRRRQFLGCPADTPRSHKAAGMSANISHNALETWEDMGVRLKREQFICQHAHFGKPLTGRMPQYASQVVSGSKEGHSLQVISQHGKKSAHF